MTKKNKRKIHLLKNENHKFLNAKNKTEKNKTLTGLLKTFSFFVVCCEGKGEKEKDRETKGLMMEYL